MQHRFIPLRQVLQISGFLVDLLFNERNLLKNYRTATTQFIASMQKNIKLIAGFFFIFLHMNIFILFYVFYHGLLRVSFILI